MNEDFNTVDEVEVGIEAPQIEESDTSEVTETVEEVATPQQTPDVNSQFAAARREAEAKAKAIEQQNQRLLQALNQYGYQGTPEEIADTLLAQTQGITVEEAQAQRKAEEQANSEREQLKSEAEYYKNIAIEKLMADDLKTIQSFYPEVKDLKELGDEFFSLLGATKDALVSYEAIQAKKNRTTKPTPPNIGEVNAGSTKEKDFYTPSEVDKLTDKDYDNPKIMEIVRKSMSKWK